MIEQLQQDGHTVHTDYPTGAESLTALTDADEDAEVRPGVVEAEHTSCPGNALYLRVYGAGEEDYTVRAICTRPDLHHSRYRYGISQTSTPKGVARPGESEEDRIKREEAEAEAKRAERARVIGNNKAWRTATTVRREWVTALIGRKTLPKDHVVFLAESLTRHVQALTEYRADDCVAAFLGRDDQTMFRRSNAADLVADNPTKAAHVALAVALSAREARTADEHSWRSINPLVKDYLLTLEAWGYHLSDVERLAAGYPEHQ